MNSGGFGWELHLLWQVRVERGDGEWVGLGVSWKGEGERWSYRWC